MPSQPGRQDDQIGGLVPGHRVGGGPGEQHVIGCRRRAAASGVRPVADEHEPRRGHPPQRRGPRLEQESCPFCRHSRPTHTTSGAAGSTPASSGMPGPYGVRGRGVETLGVDAVGDHPPGGAIPARTPVARSASLTHTTRDAQRAPHRSHAQRERRGGTVDGLERPGVRLEHRRHPSAQREPGREPRLGAVRVHHVGPHPRQDHRPSRRTS